MKRLHRPLLPAAAFTLAEAELPAAEAFCREHLGEGSQLQVQSGLAKLSIGGAGIMGRPGVAAQQFDGLSKVGISLRMIATSDSFSTATSCTASRIRRCRGH